MVLPESAKILQYVAYTGRRGEKGTNYDINWNDYSRDSNIIEYVNKRPFKSREGITIAVSWPKGVVIAPSKMEEISFFLQDLFQI